MPNGRSRRVQSGRSQLATLRTSAKTCKRCELWRHATQTVFGKGPPRARVMFVGEQPGDAEDLAGLPFVGPAGRLLREALRDAGIDPADVYLTNVVKHFKWTPRGKRRIHERPRYEEILACRPWLDGEITSVRPRAIVALGATAARTILGTSVRVTRDRAKAFASELADFVTVTVHPSAILRARDAEARAEGRRQLVADLRKIAKVIAARARKKQTPDQSGVSVKTGGADGTRTRDLRRDRPAF
jgi:uracil-DNA glycosylase family protein